MLHDLMTKSYDSKTHMCNGTYVDIKSWSIHLQLIYTHNTCSFSFSIFPLIAFKVPKVKNGSQREIPYVFETKASVSMMANIAMPMGESATFKKMLKKKAWLGAGLYNLLATDIGSQEVLHDS